MAMPMRGCIIVQQQGYSTTEPEIRASVLLQEEQEDFKDNKFVVDNEPERPDPSKEQQVQKENGDSKADYVTIELPQNVTIEQ